MTLDQALPNEIDEYIARFPKDVREVLQKIRMTIKSEVPEATETIKYNMPTFVSNGDLIYFAAYKNHVSIYPAPRGSDAFKDELSFYKGGKGTLQLQLIEPIPYDLIRRIARFLADKNTQSAKKNNSR